MSELRENIAKAIAYDLEEGPAHGARVATTPHLDNYHINGHVNLLALADAVLAVVSAKGASGRFTNRDELIRLIDKASGGYNPCRNAVADAILAVLTPAEGELPNARNRIEARDKLIETLEAENTRLVVLVERLQAQINGGAS